MAIHRKPTVTNPQASTNVESFIEQGGSVPLAPKKEKAKAIQYTQLRLTADEVELIDKAREGRRPKPSRHAWILEAIYEKVNTETSNQT
ncbi:hypothetical protein [Zooshikella ganghwensis]|uniref:Uncharacterized protein n=1 Tax=Zooshikella ganghwensis TaxID=202772 RepID=A0A4P9VGH6_9GAMM|nr:hypothetical protein [Zooshikella ganghwensis]RDH41187.1 hypothetical protein B9G39_29740 [Zooshikella ganghwensis]